MATETGGPLTRELPAIVVPEYAFIPLGCSFTLTFTRMKDIGLIKSLAKEKLSEKNGKDIFRGTVVLIPGKLKMAKAMEGGHAFENAFLDLAVEASIESCCKISGTGKLRVRFLSIFKVDVVKYSVNNINMAEVQNIKEYGEDSYGAKSLRKTISEMMDKFMKTGTIDTKYWTARFKDIGTTAFVDILIANFRSIFGDAPSGVFSDEELDELFHEIDVSKRLHCLYEKMRACHDALEKELAEQVVQDKIDAKVKKHMLKLQNEHILRVKKEEIVKELAEMNPQEADDERMDEEFVRRIEEANMPDDVKKIAKNQLDKLRTMRSDSAETNVVRNYLDWLCSMPWNTRTEDTTKPSDIQRILDEDHYGLDKVKRRIVEYMAVKKLNPKANFPILALIGPPGVGKTSLANSLARATGRRLFRKSLGGIKEEADIRGHRRTYVGAIPGFVIYGLRKAGVKNPIYVLDEIDKIGSGKFKGDAGSALLEVLDKEVNVAFSDHYLEVGFDLSEIMFICTGNVLEDIPMTLRDRMYIIELEGYTPDQKYQIAKQHLVAKQIQEHGLDAVGAEISFTDGAIYEIIDSYARESGVRELERQIASVCRSLAVNIAESAPPCERIVIGKYDLPRHLGQAKYDIKDRIEIDRPGIGVGLAYTMYGGTTLVIGSCKMQGTGKLVITGNAAEVMQESAQIAFTCAKRYLSKHVELLPAGFDLQNMLNTDVHVQFERNSVPKDGPSAGAMMTLIFISLLTGRKIRDDIAGTGEITFRAGGKITAIGGVKHKLIAANREGFKTVFIPSANMKDIVELPEQIRQELRIVPVDNIHEVVTLALL